MVEPKGALYVFPRLDPDVYPIKDDQQFALDLLEEERILITQGTGFNWPDPDHLRIVTLPWARDLSDAIQRIANGTDVGGILRLDITTDDVGLAPFHDHADLITPETQAAIDAAIAAMKAGTLEACEPQEGTGFCVIPEA